MPKQKYPIRWSDVPVCVDVPYVCMMLRISYYGVLRMIRAKKIKAARVGREYRITKTELQRILGEEVAP